MFSFIFQSVAYRFLRGQCARGYSYAYAWYTRPVGCIVYVHTTYIVQAPGGGAGRSAAGQLHRQRWST